MNLAVCVSGSKIVMNEWDGSYRFRFCFSQAKKEGIQKAKEASEKGWFGGWFGGGSKKKEKEEKKDIGKNIR